MDRDALNKNNSQNYQKIVEEINQFILQRNTQQQEQQKFFQNKNPRHSSSPTGIKEFDDILEGGFSKGAVILLAGSSGSGKTIFSFQWMFEGIKHGEKGVYITLTEPIFKILENLEKLSYYDREAVERGDIKIIDLRDIFSGRGHSPKAIIDYIAGEVKRLGASRLCIDSITAIAYQYNERSSIRSFIFELGKVLAVLGCTTVLISEVHDFDHFSVYDVEEFISDGIIRLDQVRRNNILYRILRIVKMRGRSFPSEEIPMRISRDGIELFPKIKPMLSYNVSNAHLSTGCKNLDKMMNGGLLQGSTTLIAGPTGTGKTILSLQFLVEGLKNGESCFYMDFEESKDQLFRNAKSFGWDLESFEKEGLLTVLCVYPSEKLLEEHLKEIINIVEKKKVKRCVIDSLSALFNYFEDDALSEFALRLNGFLKHHDVTTLFTAITGTVIGASTLADSKLSSITDNIIMLRYVEIQGRLESVINILKARGSNHERDLRRYKITEEGLNIEEPLRNYEGVMTGVSKKIVELKKESEELRKVLQEKEKAEFQLKEYADRFKKLFNNMVDPIVIVDSKGKILTVNDAIERVTGFKKEELIGRNFLKMPLVTRRSKIILIKNLMKRMAGIKVKPYTVTVVTKDEKKIVYEVNATTINYNGETADMAAFREVTYRPTDSTTVESQLFDHVSQKVFQKNKDFVYIYVNDAYASFLGYPIEDILGKTDHDLYTSEDAEKKQLEDKQVLETGKTLLSNETIENIEIYTIKTPVLDEVGNIDGILGMIWEKQEISENKYSEKEVQEKWI